tara:strand:+ start:336 stop:902 length:567 start_codon:yes stop_codon:yes gene_type:complete
MTVVTNNTIQPSSGQALTIKDEGGTASITVATNGEATFAENIILTANKGLSFKNHSVSSVTGASSTASANVLDEYEHGSFTLTNSGGLTSSTQCEYIKIGRLVKLTGIVYLGTGTISSSYGGLPFNVANGEKFRGGGIVVWQNSVANTTYSIMMDSNSDYFSIRLGQAGTAFGTGKVFYFTAEYIAGS